jgi:hypothetical protein
LYFLHIPFLIYSTLLLIWYALRLILPNLRLATYNITYDFIIESNLTESEINEAYNIAKEKIGIHLKNHVANEYEEPYLTLDQKEKIEKFLGPVVIADYGEPFTDEKYDIDDYIYLNTDYPFAQR